MEIDLGTRAIRDDYHKDDQAEFVMSLVRSFTHKLNSVFQGIEIKGFPVLCNPDGELVGKWTQGIMYTMTHQSVLLGIPAMQIELPRSIRALLIRDDLILRKFAEAILETYSEVIVPKWKDRKTELIINYSLSKQLVETKLNYEKIKEMADEYHEWDQRCEDLLI